MKKILSIMACFAFIFVGGLTLAACGGSEETVSSDEFSEFVKQEGVVSEFSGYELDLQVVDLSANATVVSDGENVDAKITFPSLDGSEGQVIYVKDNNVYFGTGEDKFYMALADYSNSMQDLSSILAYSGDLSDMMIEFVGRNSGFEIVKKTDGDTVTFTAEASYTVGGTTTESSAEIVYINNVLNKLIMVSQTNGVTISNVSLSSYSGEISVPDISTYKPFSTEIALGDIQQYLADMNCDLTAYNYSAAYNYLSYDAKVAMVDGDLQAEISVEDGRKIYVKDGVLYLENGDSKLKKNYDAITSGDGDDFATAKDFVLNALIVEDDETVVFNKAVITGNLSYVAEMIKQGFTVTFNRTTSGVTTTFTITMEQGGMQASLEFSFENGKLTQYSSGDYTMTTLADEITFPSFDDFVQA